uniref:Prefoldin subunit 4 n=1 Tax=Prasinoderma singulare TaxID=676789 RepID=A0A7S3FA87_9VIRI|mmetsp:Transcript_16620/g.51658  ORF Transcript_16620/g.51658 Transcript_16620/m.51658 type:complete len:126 (+) Transcript_16620:75-452(+)
MVMAETDTVTKEDQQKINEFSALNSRLNELQLAIKAKREDMENYEEASNELMLADDEEVRYMLGEVFVTMPNETAEEKMQEATEAAEKALEEHEAEVENIRTQMDDLKAALKVKFGNSIQLEEDP